jgi:hypothetical protein
MFDKPPRLPYDVLVAIAHLNICNYKHLLAIARFARKTMGDRAQRLHQSSLTKYRTFTYTSLIGCSVDVEEWYLETASGKKIYHSCMLPDGNIGPGRIEWLSNEFFMREDTSDRRKLKEIWYYAGKYHRLNAPACIEYYDNGQQYKCSWFVKGKDENCSADGRRGPTTIAYNVDGQIRAEWWTQDGLLHRIDGPAIVFHDLVEGVKYYIHGRLYTKEDYETQLERRRWN